MAQSVGMFQRPVEYRVNCLELVYDIPALNLTYVNLDMSPMNVGLPNSFVSFGNFNLRTNIIYTGYAEIKICFFNEDGISFANLIPLYRINTVHTVDLFYKSDDYSSNVDRIYQAHNTALSSFNSKIQFYDQMIDWVKLKLIENGNDEEKVTGYQYMIHFPFRECFNANRDCNDFYLKSGSAFYENGVNTNIIVPVGENADGITLWDYPGAGVFNTTLRPSGVGVGDGRSFYLDQLVIQKNGNYIDPISLTDTNISEDKINDFYNFFKNTA